MPRLLDVGRAAAFAVMAASAVVASGANATPGSTYRGVLPKPLFSTPQNAVYCHVAQVDAEDSSAKLLCWTPNDGWGVSIGWRSRRATTAYYTRHPRVVHGTGVLKGYRPRSPRVLRSSERWIFRCTNRADVRTCHGRGPIAFTCTSRATGLTCRNDAEHGFWIGRFRGYRLFQED